MTAPKEYPGRLWELIDKANYVSFMAGALLLFITIFIVSLEVAGRYLFSWSLGWGFEVTEYALVVSTFLTVGYILAQEGHLKITLVTSRLSRKRQIQLRVLVLIISLAYGLALLWASWPIAWESFRLGLRSETQFAIPLWPHESAVPVGSLLFSLQCIAGIAKNVSVLRSKFACEADLQDG